MQHLVEGIMIIVELYALLGVLIAPILIFWGAGRFDEAAAESTRGFRLMVLPGAVLLWPLLLRRFLQAQGSPPVELNRHRALAAAGKDGGNRIDVSSPDDSS